MYVSVYCFVEMCSSNGMSKQHATESKKNAFLSSSAIAIGCSELTIIILQFTRYTEVCLTHAYDYNSINQGQWSRPKSGGGEGRGEQLRRAKEQGKLY